MSVSRNQFGYRLRSQPTCERCRNIKSCGLFLKKYRVIDLNPGARNGENTEKNTVKNLEKIIFPFL